MYTPEKQSVDPKNPQASNMGTKINGKIFFTESSLNIRNLFFFKFFWHSYHKIQIHRHKITHHTTTRTHPYLYASAPQLWWFPITGKKMLKKKSKNCRIRKKSENFKTSCKNLKKCGLFSEFRTSMEKSVMLATLLRNLLEKNFPLKICFSFFQSSRTLVLVIRIRFHVSS